MFDAPTPARHAWHRLVLAVYALGVWLLVSLAVPPAPGPCVLGDQRSYLAGHIPAGLWNTEFDAAAMAVGLGTAAVGDWRTLGDALVAGGRLYLRSAAADTPPHRRLIRARRFRTSSFLFLPATAAWPDRLTPVAGATLEQLLQQLSARYPRGAVMTGYVRFRVLTLWTVSRAAIDGLPVAEHVTDYYTEPARTATDAWAYLVGVGARRPLPAPQRDDPLYQRMLAPRPDDTELGEVHALLLAAPPADPDFPPDSLAVLDVGQVARGSVIDGGTPRLHPFARLVACSPPPAADIGEARAIND
jgi:hypothetical protein